MAKIALWLNPRRLENPDTDLRYVIPELLAELSNGVLSDDGFHYVDNVDLASDLLLFLTTEEVEIGLTAVKTMIDQHQVMGNDLRTIVVAVDQGQGYRVTYPEGFFGSFPV